jgi:hypothetical protein
MALNRNESVCRSTARSTLRYSMSTLQPKDAISKSPSLEASSMLTEMENLAIDMHGQWLDVFTVCPIPAMVLSTAEQPHEVLLANMACTTTLARDASSLVGTETNEVFTLEIASRVAEATTTSLEFSVPPCQIQISRFPIACEMLLMPISDVCSSAKPQCYLALLLDEFTQGLCKAALAEVPTMESILTSSDAKSGRTGLYCMGDRGAAWENYSQSHALQITFDEASQRRRLGKSPAMRMPAPFDAPAWIKQFKKLLTVEVNKASL